ncbi:hypothetical protein [uncultured Roseovarius sp.]|uniref:hypothetical protein n=1 Tax=uncultured Roseovarius sp. TaxID=293344 RepID=UPI0026263682|nr:hypothetical protein [uncultured Roseovarius sp.]
MKLRAGLICLLLIPGPAFADNCAALKTLVGLAQSDFADGKPDDLLREVESCDLSRDETGMQTYLCTWKFHYRAPGAAAVFDVLNRLIPVCVRGVKSLPEDTDVNHPDSYELRRYQRGKVVISTSLKDKAELEQTLTFLRLDVK